MILKISIHIIYKIRYLAYFLKSSHGLMGRVMDYIHTHQAQIDQQTQAAR